ncbi:MAG: LysR family transcriptional regulator [Rhodobacter sp.]|nr:LysR family transcriptional regulator [Rhodobacter sp.]
MHTSPLATIRQLRYFVATAQTGSATRAAALLNVSQPSVSAAIRELEVELGQPLFHRRHAQGLELTGFGADRLARARAVLDAGTEFMTTAATTTHLTLGYFETLGPLWVPGMAAALTAAVPGLVLDLLEGDLEQMTRALERGKVDLALIYDIGLPATIARDTITEMAPYALMAPGHPLAAQSSVTLEALAAYPFILVDLPVSREFLMVPFWQKGLAPRILLRTRSVDMVRSMVAQSDAVSLLFTPAMHDQTSGGHRVISKPLPQIGTRQRLVVGRASTAVAGRIGDLAVAAIRASFAMS